MRLSVNIGRAVFENPVTVASGTFVFGERYYDLAEIRRLGAVIPKTVTLAARAGNPPPRIVETPAGMLNAIGIENPGLDAFLREKLPALRRIGVPVIVSVLGHGEEEWVRLVEALDEDGTAAAVELNLSCPNLGDRHLLAQDPDAVRRLLARLKSCTALPLIAKLSPQVTDITRVALAAETGGADAVSLVNTFPGMKIDVEARRPVLGNGGGGLSGPAIRPMAVHLVRETARAVKIPVVGMGGIATADDALEFLIAGATMVAVGTANFLDPRTPVRVLDGIRDYLRRHRMKDIHEVIGSMR